MRYYRGLEILQKLDGPATIDDLATDLDIEPADVAERVAYLESFDRVACSGGTVSPRVQ